MVILISAALPAYATPEFSAETNKDCAYCHTTPGGSLTPEGEAFRDYGFRIPPTATSGSDTTSSTTVGVLGDESTSVQRGPTLSLGRWLRPAVLWAHILAVIAWLGGIISVFLIQRRQISAGGIPRGYLRLAWSSSTVVGITGIFLTLGMVGDASVLRTTRWGALLLTKISIFTLLVIIAAVATFVISPRLVKLVDIARRLGRSQEHFKAQGRVTVLYRGRVYDLTGSRLWPEGRHARRHDAWQDLTAALTEAPHGPDVLERFTLVEDAGEDRTPLPMRVYMVMTFVSIVLVLAVVLVVAAW